MTLTEIMALQKRRRTKYRISKNLPFSYTEEIRHLINDQMEVLQEHLKSKTVSNFVEDGKVVEQKREKNKKKEKRREERSRERDASSSKRKHKEHKKRSRSRSKKRSKRKSHSPSSDRRSHHKKHKTRK